MTTTPRARTQARKSTIATPPAEHVDRRWLLLTIGAGIVYLVLALGAAAVETPTVDEFAHLPAGCAYLRHGTLGLYAKNPPLMKELMAFPVVAANPQVPAPEVPPYGWGPWQYGLMFQAANSERYFDLFFRGRVVVVLAGLLAGCMLFVWARKLWDGRAAAVVTSLYFLDPTILAHSHLATVDVGAMTSLFLCVFTLRFANRHPSLRRTALAGLSWGIALLIKFTAALLLPAIVILVACARGRHWKQALLDCAVILGVALLVINLGMGFNGTGKPVSQFEFVSASGILLKRIMPDWLPLPLPADYIEGFDAQKRDTEAGEFGSYLFGRWSDRGWWYYNFVALAVKSPLPFLASLLACPWFLRRSGMPRTEWLTILVPLFVLICLLMAFNRLNIGIRYLLPAFPFLYLLTGSVWRREGGRWQTPAALIAVLATLIGVVRVHPNYLTYFNLMAGGPEHGHRLLIDSNLDWGQDLYRLRPALDSLGHRGPIGLLYFGHVHPAAYGIDYGLVPPRAAPGIFAVSVNYLMGASYATTAPNGELVTMERDHAAWLRDYEPVAKAGTIWIFDTRSR